MPSGVSAPAVNVDAIPEELRERPQWVNWRTEWRDGKATKVPGGASKGRTHTESVKGMPRAELAMLIQQLQDQMHEAARELSFELAARLRDEVAELKRELRQMEKAGHLT